MGPRAGEVLLNVTESPGAACTTRQKPLSSLLTLQYKNAGVIELEACVKAVRVLAIQKRSGQDGSNANEGAWYFIKGN